MSRFEGMTRRRLAASLGALGLGLTVLPAAMRRAARAAEDQLTYFTWSGYEIPELHRRYVDKHGASPEFSFFSDEEEALQKVRSGFGPDIAHPCLNTLGRWRDAGAITPIRTERVEAWGGIFPEFLAIEGVQHEGAFWFVPFDWGTSSILYRTDLVEIGEESWTLLLDERYKGRMAFLDAIDNVAAVAGLLSGAAEPMRMTDEELARARDLLKTLHGQMRFYWSDPTEMEQAMASGEIVAAWAWGQSANNLQKQGVPVKYMNPKEGIMTWVCGLTHIASGKAPEDKVYDFINAMLDPGTGKYLIEQIGYGHGNAESFAQADPEKVKALGFTDPKSFLAQGNFFEEVPPDTRQKIATMWQEIRAGG